MINKNKALKDSKEFDPKAHAEKVFKPKKEFHKAQAQLPIEEKVKILVELQKIGKAANPKMKDKKVWKI